MICKDEIVDQITIVLEANTCYIHSAARNTTYSRGREMYREVARRIADIVYLNNQNKKECCCNSTLRSEENGDKLQAYAIKNAHESQSEEMSILLTEGARSEEEWLRATIYLRNVMTATVKAMRAILVAHEIIEANTSAESVIECSKNSPHRALAALYDHYSVRASLLDKLTNTKGDRHGK